MIAQEKFGLDAYQLERHSIYKERDSLREMHIIHSIWSGFLRRLNEPIEEDYNPEGTAIVEYAIQKQLLIALFSCKANHFPQKLTFRIKPLMKSLRGLKRKLDCNKCRFQNNTSECKWISI